MTFSPDNRIKYDHFPNFQLARQNNQLWPAKWVVPEFVKRPGADVSLNRN